MHGFKDVMAREPMGLVSIPVGETGSAGPNCYAVVTEGDCLSPEYQHGDILVCDPDQTPKSGDFVTIWWKGGKQKPSVKRLALSLPPREFWGSGGDLEGVIMCEQLCPPRHLQFGLAQIEAVHKVIAKAASV